MRALIDAPAPTQVLCVSEWLSGAEWLEVWSKHTGIPSRYEESTKIHIQDDPSGLSLHFSQTMKYIEDFGYTCGDPDVLMPEDVSAGYVRRDSAEGLANLCAAREEGVSDRSVQGV